MHKLKQNANEVHTPVTPSTYNEKKQDQTQNKAQKSFQSNIVLTFKERNSGKFRKCLFKFRIIPSRNKHLFMFEIQVIEIITKSRKTVLLQNVNT